MFDSLKSGGGDVLHRCYEIDDATRRIFGARHKPLFFDLDGDKYSVSVVMASFMGFTGSEIVRVHVYGIKTVTITRFRGLWLSRQGGLQEKVQLKRLPEDCASETILTSNMCYSCVVTKLSGYPTTVGFA